MSYCTVHYRTESYSSTVSCFATPYRTIPNRTLPYEPIPHDIVQTILPGIPHNIARYSTVQYQPVLCHTIPYHTLPNHTIRCRTMAYRAIPNRPIVYHTVPYCTMPYEENARCPRENIDKAKPERRAERRGVYERDTQRGVKRPIIWQFSTKKITCPSSLPRFSPQSPPQ